MAKKVATKAVEPEEIETQGIFEAEEGKTGITGVYEIGYHLLPNLSESEVTNSVKDIAAFLNKAGASVVGEAAPERIDLAYTISKRINGVITPFNEASFGWVAFEAPRASMASITQFLDTHASVLRYICISTSKEEVKAIMEGAIVLPVAQASTEAIKAPKRTAEAEGVVTDEALGAALDTMATEDAPKSE